MSGFRIPTVLEWTNYQTALTVHPLGVDFSIDGASVYRPTLNFFARIYSVRVGRRRNGKIFVGICGLYTNIF